MKDNNVNVKNNEDTNAHTEVFNIDRKNVHTR